VEGAATWQEDFDDGEYRPEVDYAERWAEAQSAAERLMRALEQAGIAVEGHPVRLRPHMSRSGRPWVKLTARSADLLVAYLVSMDTCPK
jgi:hypothetical protein